MAEFEMELDDPVGDPVDFGHVLNEIKDGEVEVEEGYAAAEEEPAPLTTVEGVKLDLEVLSKSYTGYALMNRLLFIADVCPSLRSDALLTLIDYVTKNTQNVPMLQAAYGRVEKAKQSGQITGIDKIPPLESWNNWIEHTSTKAQNHLDACLAEFKRQKEEAVKESIRRSLDELKLFHQYMSMGKLQEAHKLYARGLREYCSGPSYVLQMLISWINATIYSESWSKLASLIQQAERAIQEITEREAAPGNRSAGTTVTTKELVSPKAKIRAIAGLCKMERREFKAAAEAFIGVDIDALEYPEGLSAEDVALYGALCALATFSRSELKNRLLSSALYRRFLESEPKLVELLQKFVRSEFGTCFDILNDLKGQLLLNVYLSPHVNILFEKIRQSAIVQYFQPYLSLHIEALAAEFRIGADQMESYLVTLIDEGSLKGRIDLHERIVYAKFKNSREQVLQRAVEVSKELSGRVNCLLLRAALINHKVVVGRLGGRRADGGGKVQKRKGGQGASSSRFQEEDDDEFDEDEGDDVEADLSMDLS